MITKYHAKLFAHELSRRHSVADAEKLAGALLDAQVDLNPHQVEAALFAFKSPLSKGAILADEVGLGKTIEAGLVLAQKWTEGRRRILVVTPANLRKQWAQEIAEKFFLPSVILEARNYNKMAKDGVRRPFEQKALVICSFQFAARHAEELMVIPWDLVVIDEAHRLRNVYRPDNRIGRTLKGALANAPKVLLTATPLQNSLMELYGLVSLIDDYAFGDAKSFRAQYARLSGDGQFDELKGRLKPVCHRTLRRQVLEYIRYTNRIPITQEFVPTEAEQTLYDMVSDYLRRPSLQALPSSQRTLMTLIMQASRVLDLCHCRGARLPRTQAGAPASRRYEPSAEVRGRDCRGLRGIRGSRRRMGGGRRRAGTSHGRRHRQHRAGNCRLAGLPRSCGFNLGERKGPGADQRASRRLCESDGARRCGENDHLHGIPPYTGISRPVALRERL